MERRLFELVTQDGCAISPYAWRARFALASKKLHFQSCGIGFTEIAGVGEGRFRSLPVLQDGGRWVGDSWAIATHLDEHYPDGPPLFQSPAEYQMARFFEKWFLVEIVSTLFRIVVLDIHNRLKPEDRAYFRQSREQRLGQTLEAAHAAREEQLPLLEQKLQPMRLHLRESPFVGGSSPTYADYIAAGGFIWAGSVATLELLGPGDSILPWLRRALELLDDSGASPVLSGIPLGDRA